jgi:serine/threonine protein kinase
MPSPCPTPERLAAALRATQPEGEDPDLEAHLAECPACQTRIEAMVGGDVWLETKARMRPSQAASPLEPLQKAMQALASRPQERARTIPPNLGFLQPSDQPGALGRFGPYEVLAHIASGGMGIVLKARDPALDRIVALKILPPFLAANALARARFVREARAAAAVDHEHVVPIYAVDECEGLSYLVMQFVPGQPLSERLRLSGPLRLEECLRIGAQTAAGLAAAHAQGLVHRDVKPGNILLENSVERVKLTDFGLARAVDDAGLTRTGELSGTPEFMAPEQAGDGPVDHRADLFSLGSVLYAMSTGCSPFQADSVVRVLRRLCEETPPPACEVNPSVPRWLSDIIGRLMAKTPGERFQTAREVAELLQEYLARVQRGELEALPNHRPPPRPARRRRFALAVIVAVALPALSGLVLFLLHQARLGPFEEAASPVVESLSPGAEASSRPPARFTIRDPSGILVGEYADAREAFEAAPANAVVELRWNGPSEMPPVALSAKPLTLRAAQGFHPVWIHASHSEAALASDAALTVEGIEFVLGFANNGFRGGALRGPSRRPGPGGSGPRARGERPEPSGVALIAVTNASLKMSRCLLRSEDQGGPRAVFARMAGILLHHPTTCEIESSAFITMPAKAIVWQGDPPGPGGPPETPSLTLSNCLAHGNPVIWLDLPKQFHPRLRIVRSAFSGPNFLYFPRAASLTGLVVIAENNLFNTGTVFRDSRRADSFSPIVSVRWRGHENLFSPDSGYLDVSERTGLEPVTTLAGWNRWWGQTNQNARQVQVTYADRASDTKPDQRHAHNVSAFKVTALRVVAGPPLPDGEWERFGADLEAIGPPLAAPNGQGVHPADLPK